MIFSHSDWRICGSYCSFQRVHHPTKMPLEIEAQRICSVTWSANILTTHSMVSRMIWLYGYAPQPRRVSTTMKTHPSGQHLSSARANRKNLYRCHLDFANAIVALRRMAQFSASSQIGLFQDSPRAMEPLPLQHDARLAKMLTKAAGCQKAVNRS